MPKLSSLNRYQTRFRAMGSPCQLTVYAPDPVQAATGLQAAQARVQQLETKYSRYQPDTITSRINRSAGTGQRILLDHETHRLLCLAAQGYQLSDGLFDITSGVLRQVWDFKRGHLPDQAALEAVLPLISWSQVRLRQDSASTTHTAGERPADADAGWLIALPMAGMEIDFGGVVKEYAADAAAKALLDCDIRHGFVDLGGDLSIIGPHPTMGRWPIGVRDPRQPTRPVSRLQVSAGAVATSGDYERFFERNGVRYCHILNPHTGWPASGWASVTVVTQPCVVAGMAATIAMLKGLTDGLAWLQSLGVPFFAVTAPVTNPDMGTKQGRQIVTDQSASDVVDRVLGLATS